MSLFMPQKPEFRRAVLGSLQSDILIVCPNPDGYAMKENKPIGHGAETVLQDALHQAGLIVQEVCTTSLIYDRTNLNDFWRDKGAKGPSQLKGDISGYKRSLWEFIQKVKPKVIVAVGDIVSFALIGNSKITTIRGYPFQLGDTGIWVIPTLDPHKMVWQNYVWRYYLAHDLKKAKQIAKGEKIAWPETEIIIPQSFEEARAWLEELRKHKRLAVDIEVSNYHTSCISFSYKWYHGISFPIDMRWTEEQELYIWNGLAAILSDPTIEKIMQNGAFDVQFLMAELGIFVRNFKDDTMISHHIMYPDFLKGLGFLASIYTCHAFWKDELDFKSIKEDD